MNSLGERIAYYRKKVNLTQEQLAEKCSVTAQAVSKWENDLTAPDLSLIPALAQLFNITCDELLGAHRAEIFTVAPDLVNLTTALLRIKVNTDDGDKVNVNLPLSVAEIALKSGMINIGNSGDALKNIDIKQIVELVKQGAMGKLVEINTADGDNVEIWVE